MTPDFMIDTLQQELAERAERAEQALQSQYLDGFTDADCGRLPAFLDDAYLAGYIAYRVVVSNTANQTGKYGFSVIDTVLVPVAAFDQVITGTLAPGTEDDVYRFTGTKGQKLFFDKLDINGGNLNWALYDDKNQVVLYSSSFDDRELYLPKDGEYRLALQGQSSLGSVIKYSFEIITPDDITIPVQLGNNQFSNSVYAEITEKGETDFYTFTGAIGQRIYFDQLALNATQGFIYTATLLDPSGQKVLEYNFQAGRDPSPLTLSKNGTYTVVIDATGEGTGRYGFSLLDMSKATAIALDTNYTNTLEPGREAHLYQFAGNKGQRVFIDALTASVSGLWTLYDSGNQQIASNILSWDMEVVLDDADTYTLVVQGYDDTPANYSFRIITPDTIVTPLNLNTPILMTIAEKGEQDIYTFNGSRGQRLFLDTVLDNSQVRATLVSPNGTKVFDSIDLYNSRDLGRYPVILPDNGQYQLILDGDGETTGSYGFQLVDLSAAPLLATETLTTDLSDGGLKPGLETDVYRLIGNKGDRFYFDSQQSINGYWSLYSPGNVRLSAASLSSDFEAVLPGDGTYYLMLQGATPADANYQFQVVKTTVSPSAYSLNTVQTGAIAKLGEQDVYTFAGTQGQRIFFDAIAGSPAITVKILNSSGNELYSGTTNVDGTAFTLTETGSYQIVMDGQTDTTGSYSFQIATTPAPAQVSRGGAEALSFNTSTSTTLAANQSKTYKFTGSVGQKLWLDGLNSSYVAAIGTLYNPGGTELGKLYDFQKDGGLFTLQENGEYYFVLSNSTQPGTLSFRLLDTSVAGLIVPDGGDITGAIDSGSRGSTVYRLNGQAGQHLFFDSKVGSYYDALLIYGTDGKLLVNQSMGNDFKVTLPTDGEYTVVLAGQGYGNSYRFEVIASTWQDSTLNVGDPVVGNVAKVGQENSYTFTGAANQLLYLDSLDRSAYLRFRLYSPTGEEVLKDSSYSDIEPFSLKESGSYRLVVDGGDYNSTGSYRFRLQDLAAANYTTLDTDITGSLQALETQFHRFTAAQGQYVLLDPNTGGYYSNYTLYNAAGQQIFAPRSLYPQSGYQYEMTLPYSGDYILALRSNESASSDYSLRIVTPDWGYGSLTLGQTIAGEIREGGERDIYKFTATIGQQILFDGLQGNSFIEIYASSGKRISTANLRSYQDDETFNLTEAGTYTVVVDNYGDQVGQYQFRLLDWTASTPIAPDTRITGDFGSTRSESRLYRFSGSAGERFFFNSYKGSNNNVLEIISADGNTNVALRRSIANDFDFVLPKDGEYTILLRGDGYSAPEYEFSLVTPDLTTRVVSIGETVTAQI